MAQNNLIRPPILLAPEGSESNQAPNAQARPAQPVMSHELQTAINSMVQIALNTQGRDLFNYLINQEPSRESICDEIIEERFRQDLGEIDKVPDVVRYLKDFSGNPSEFGSWKKSVDRILQIYDSTKGTPKYFGIINVIRNKIVGNADTVLESYNTPLNWTAISKCLTLHYADKRDISTLEYQLMSIAQGNNSVEEFYKRVYSHLSLILNKISCMEIDNNSISLLTQTYRNKALDTFIRGLNGDLPRILAIREPADLPQALHLCLKLENQNFRNAYAKNKFQQNYRPPTLPQRKSTYAVPNHYPHYQQQQQQQYQQHKQFFPQLAHFPQYPRTQPQYNYQNNSRNNQSYQQQPPPRPIAPKPQYRGEPMEVDPSTQTRRVNYMNRPNPDIQNGKRPASTYANMQKRQRHFNIYSDLQQHPAEDVDHNVEDTLQLEKQYQELPTQDFTDVHFLE